MRRLSPAVVGRASGARAVPRSVDRPIFGARGSVARRMVAAAVPRYGAPMTRLRPPRLDVAIAAVLVAAAWAEAFLESTSVPPLVDALATLPFTVPLAWRRRAPLAVLLVAIAAIVAYGRIEADGPHQTLIFALALASFTVGYEVEPPRSYLAPSAIVVGLGVSVAVGEEAGDAPFVVAMYGLPWLFGLLLRARERRVVELERGREAREREVLEAERARIARELHDVVSHSISVVAVQTQAVRRRLGPEHGREADDLLGVETAARQALAEMRRLLGVLRADGERPPLAPQPGLDQLPRLLERTRAAGLPVELHVEGTATPLPPGVDLAAYRVVQESLTNALKHAGEARATVALRYGDGRVEVTVEDDGAGGAAANGGGHGLVGMRERVALYGGTLEAGRGGDGFRVHAVLPVREEALP
jgi:signal transduction histidine kinase